MGLLEKDRIEQKEREREYLETSFRDRVALGKSAERLLSNPDWRRYSDGLRAQIESYNNHMLEIFKSQVLKSESPTVELDHVACNNIRIINAQVFQLERILNQPEEEARAGVEAQKELDRLREGE